MYDPNLTLCFGCLFNQQKMILKFFFLVQIERIFICSDNWIFIIFSFKIETRFRGLSSDGDKALEDHHGFTLNKKAIWSKLKLKLTASRRALSSKQVVLAEFAGPKKGKNV